MDANVSRLHMVSLTQVGSKSDGLDGAQGFHLLLIPLVRDHDSSLSSEGPSL